MGVEHDASCLGCCAGLMRVELPTGLVSVTSLAVVAALGIWIASGRKGPGDATLTLA